MKDVFARHGIPSELVSDNGSQYKSLQFRKFAKEWDFQHSTSSPRYPRSNGLAESSVKTVKKMMKKCLATNKDIQQGLLAIRNTPLACGASPAELLMNRRLNDNLPRLPTSNDTIQPPKRNLVAERKVQKHYHDKNISSRTISEGFRPKQRVALQDPSTKEWTLRGQIVEEVAPRSYTVQLTNGTVLRQNRCHIRKLYSTTSNTNNFLPPLEEPQELIPTDDELTEESQYDESDSDTIPYDHSSEEEAEEDEPCIPRRSNRTVKIHRPLDYQDL